jgi:peroxiredoxin Q/BCP
MTSFDAASSGTSSPARRVKPGAVAPNFELVDADGRKSSLAEHRGRRVLVFFYPKALTPGCTREACDFQASLHLLNQTGVDVVGISRDPLDKLVEFREAHQLTFPLLSDPDRVAHEAYGAWGEKSKDGQTSLGVIRSTFLIDADGNIEQAMYDVDPRGHVEQLLSLTS